MEQKRYNQMGGREEIEWATIWYDKANSVKDHKILMIGESAARQIRGVLADMTGRPVDLFGSSSSLRDILFWKQLNCFFDDSIYTYDAAIIWMGHHARTDLTGNSPLSEQDYEDFSNDFSTLLDKVKKICPNVLVLSNFDIIRPLTKKEKKIRKLRKFFHLSIPPHTRDEAESEIIEKKNDIIQRVTLSESLKFLDMNNIMKQSNFARVDHVHYERKSDTYQVEKILEQLKAILE